MIFRFDDVCINTDLNKLRAMADMVRPYGDVLCSVSLLCNDMRAFSGKHSEFVFMPINKAYSDHRKFYNINKCGYPELPSYIKICSHGLVHVDHRQMHRDAQEMSILISCSMLGANTFVPPFNKWNADTESICKEHSIKLLKFEDGWLGAEYNAFNINHELWYTHAFNWTVDKFNDWLVEK